MTRIKQFANDLGIPYGTAKNLIMEGRRRKDKGSDIMRRYKDGGSNEIPTPAPRPKPGDMNEMVPFDREAYEKALKAEERLEKYMKTAPGKQAKLKRRGDDEKVVKAASGRYQSHSGGCGCDMCGGGDMVRGMGKAYQGNPRAAKIR